MAVVVAGISIRWDEIKEELRGTRREFLERKLNEAGILAKKYFGQTDIRWLRTRWAYELQEQWRKEQGLETPEAVLARLQKLDSKRTLPAWTPNLFGSERSEPLMPSKKKAAAKKTTPKHKKKTLGALMVEILRQQTVPPNAEIVRQVKKLFPESKFDGRHVSWYKGAFNAGRLPGQAGPEAYNQPQVREGGEERTSWQGPKASKKKVTKKKTTKKKAAKKKAKAKK